MNEEKIKLTQLQIQNITKELKSHYYLDEFFVDPEKKFINLLEKIIMFFEDDDLVIHIKQNEHLYLNFKEKYDSAMEVVKSIEDEKENLKNKLKKKLNKKTSYFDNDASFDISIDSEESPRIYPTNCTKNGIKIPKLNFQNMYHTVKDINHFPISSNRSYNDINNNNYDFEKLKEEYFNLYEEKKQLESQLIEHLDCPRKILNLEENLKEIKVEAENSKKKLQKFNEDNFTLQERVAKLTKENLILVESLKSTKDSLNVSERERNSIKNKISLNQSKTKVYEKEIFNTRKKIQNLNIQIKNLTKKLREESDEKLLLEKKIDDILQEAENKIYLVENEKQKAIKDSLSTLIKLINDENCMEFSYNKGNNKIEIFFEKEKIAEVNNSAEFQPSETESASNNHPDSILYLKTDQTVRKILSPLKSKMKNYSLYQNEDSKDIDQVELKKLFSQQTVSSTKSILDNGNKENFCLNNINLNLMNSQIKINSNGNSFKAKRLMRKDTLSSNKKKSGYKIPQPDLKRFNGPNPFDYNLGRNIENCIQRTNLNNSLRYVLSSNNHVKHRPMISLNFALGDDKVNECDDSIDDVTRSIKKLNFLSTTSECFEIYGSEKNNQNKNVSYKKFEIKNFDINLINKKVISTAQNVVIPMVYEGKNNIVSKEDDSISVDDDKSEEETIFEPKGMTPRTHRSEFSYENEKMRLLKNSIVIDKKKECPLEEEKKRGKCMKCMIF